ncbi:MAG: hypothetical protein L3K19_02780 [Thermoplasmata archaeon]|nr:hypothetical protein [Thermoplasmata archaeon]
MTSGAEPVQSDGDEHLLALPCGHGVRVPRGVPVIGLSGPILGHQQQCARSSQGVGAASAPSEEFGSLPPVSFPDPGSPSMVHFRADGRTM